MSRFILYTHFSFYGFSFICSIFLYISRFRFCRLDRCVCMCVCVFRAADSFSVYFCCRSSSYAFYGNIITYSILQFRISDWKRDNPIVHSAFFIHAVSLSLESIYFVLFYFICVLVFFIGSSMFVRIIWSRRMLLNRTVNVKHRHLFSAYTYHPILLSIQNHPPTRPSNTNTESYKINK